MMAQVKTHDKMEKATAQLKEWKEKLDAFNSKVPKPKQKHRLRSYKKTTVFRT